MAAASNGRKVPALWKGRFERDMTKTRRIWEPRQSIEAPFLQYKGETTTTFSNQACKLYKPIYALSLSLALTVAREKRMHENSCNGRSFCRIF